MIYSVFGLVALVVKRRHPEDGKLFKRIAVMLPLFYIMNILVIQGLYALYEWIHFTSCPPRRSMEWWVTGLACLISTVITFFNEAAAGWEKWKTSIAETEQLKYSYQKTKLLGLKGQVNPHFLFNCFNTLSSLISEDEKAAENFLDEMTKVHRYMLRNDDEPLGLLKDEITFTRSYLHLVEKRFGGAIQAHIDIDKNKEHLLLPPLSLQVILENIIYNNAISKTQPLTIFICCKGHHLEIKHSVHIKSKTNRTDSEEGLDNLIKKYELMNNPQIMIREDIHERTILLPLMEKEVRS
ncbi:MAG TPA: histidine kinase [Ferruginibacter sp.]|nr:histidine kinase [Ferruginibacter sp.]